MKKSRKERLLIPVILIFLSGCQPMSSQQVLRPILPEAGQTEPVILPELPAYETLVICGVGDVMVHSPQLKAQYDGSTYDFTNNFFHMKPYIQRADIALANLETPLAGEAAGYSGFPLFNAPDALADALKEAGFDVIATANNHTYDRGITGVVRTVEVLREKGLKPVGTRRHQQEKSYQIFEKNGIVVGISAYTYETPRWQGRPTLNGMLLKEEVVPLIDSFGYEQWEAEAEKIRQRIETMEAEGAELLVFFLHWGEEYQRRPNVHQQKIAQFLTDQGVDIIFGSHPHVLQPIEMRERGDGTGQTAVIYSMGNFISNQRLETLGNRNTEDGLLVEITVRKNLTTQAVELVGVAYLPTWVHKHYRQGRAVYEILPVLAASETPRAFGLQSHESKRRLGLSRDASMKLLENEHPLIYPLLELDGGETQAGQTGPRIN